MTDRSVLVRIRADVAQYVTGVQAAAATTKEFGIASMAASQKHKQSWDMAGKSMMIGGAVIAAGVGLAIKAAAEFDAKMSVVKANIDDKSVPSMQRLSDAALAAGKSTMFSASEAAGAENELAKAGLSAADITGGALAGALALASAGQIELGAAAEIAATSMVQFQLKAKDVPHIADLLAAGADKALGGVGDLGEALKYAGVNAAQFKIPIEETVGVLSMFAMNGLLGSMAGTGFRQMLVNLAKPSTEAETALAKYNIAAFDAQGKFVGMAGLAGQLKTQLAGLSDQERQATLVTIFGTRSLAEANIMYREGAAGVKDWTAKVNDQGFAALQASTKLDNLSGDLTKLKNTLNAAFIEGGQGAQGPLRELTQSLTGVVDTFGSLPAPVAQVALALGAVTAASLLLGGTVVLATSRIAAMKTSLMTMGVEGGKATTVLKGFGAAAAIAAVAVPLVSSGMDSLWTSMGHGSSAGNAAAKSLEAWLTTGKATGENADLLNYRLGDLGNTVDLVFNSSVWHRGNAMLSELSGAFVNLYGPTQVDEAISTFQTLDSGMATMATSGGAKQAAAMFKKVTDEAVKQGYSIDKITAAFPQYAAAVAGGAGEVKKTVEEAARDTAKLSELAVVLGSNADSTASAMRILGEGADAASDAVKNLAKAIQGDMDSAAKAFASDMDVLGGYDPQKQADAVAAAQKTLADARVSAADAGAPGRDSKGRIKKQTPAEAKAELRAYGSVQDAQAALNKARQAQSDATLESSYKRQIAAGKKFSTDISAVTARGLDPQVISRLLQEGPTKAAPVLAALLGNHSKTMIKMVNAGEKSIAAISARVMEEARLTSMAVNSQTDTMTKDFGRASAISAAVAQGGGKATIESVATQLKMTVPEVKRIAAEFGVGILSGVRAGTDPAVAAIHSIQDAVNAINGMPAVTQINSIAAAVNAINGMKLAFDFPTAPFPGKKPDGPRPGYLLPKPTSATPTRVGTSTHTQTTNQPVNIYGPVSTPGSSDLLSQAAKARRLHNLGVH